MRATSSCSSSFALPSDSSSRDARNRYNRPEGGCGMVTVGDDDSGERSGGGVVDLTHEHKGDVSHNRQEDDVVVLDCRNSYESDVGACRSCLWFGV